MQHAHAVFVEPLVSNYNHTSEHTRVIPVLSNMNRISFSGVIPPESFLNSFSIFSNFLCWINGGQPERGRSSRPSYPYSSNLYNQSHTHWYEQNIALVIPVMVHSLILIIHIACSLSFLRMFFSFLYSWINLSSVMMAVKLLIKKYFYLFLKY